MAAFNFPASPSLNDTHTENGVTFKWNGVLWRRVGDLGAQGVQGATGAQGVQGATGSGSQGNQGVQGAPGSDSSVAGPQGVQGATGAQGVQGATGAGSQGNQGVQGAPGSDSSVAGPQGVQGATGSQGVQGATGSQGVQGAAGSVATNYTNSLANSVQRTIQSKLDDFVNILDFGVEKGSSKSDTVRTNNTSRFESALAHAKRIYIPAGIYEFNDEIDISNTNTSLFGDGERVSILSWETATGANGIHWTTDSPERTLTVRDLKLRASADKSGSPIYAKDTATTGGSINPNVVIENVVAEYNGSTSRWQKGFHFEDCRNSYCNRAIFRGNPASSYQSDYGFLTNGAEIGCLDFSFFQCQVSDLRGDPGAAFLIRGACEGIHVESCLAINTDRGVQSDNHVNSGGSETGEPFVTVINCHFNTHEKGILFQRVFQSFISNNHLQACDITSIGSLVDWYGIEFGGQTSGNIKCQNIHIHQNLFHAGFSGRNAVIDRGAYITYANEILFDNNQFKGCDDPVIQFTNSVTDSQALNNRFDNCDTPHITNNGSNVSTAGSAGVQGAQGVQGAAGSPGGAQGTAGAQGNQGRQGAPGADSSVAGPQGVQGATGSQGVQGATGSGPQGVQGATGSQGVQGATGSGPQGVQGAVGAQGVQGSPGADSSVAGPQGVQGAQGHQGVQGTAGTGSQGVQGAQGHQGISGARDYTVTNSGSSHYVIDGANDPTLNLLRGFTYTFSINTSGHPFYFQTSSGAYNASNVYSTGVTGNGTQVGTITFEVPFNAPNTLYYVCQNHSGMNGTINISEVGPQGAQGVQGASGSQGVQGAVGAQGVQGSSGSTSAGFVNISDYGASTSATDGTNVTAINNAVTALGSDGGTVYIPGGSYYLNAAISLGSSNNSVRFVGAGQQNYGGGSDSGGAVLRRDADDEFFNITNSRAIHFVGITFKGGASNGSGGNSGISGGNGAIYVEANAGCQGHLIENCVFHGIKNCIHWKGLSDSIIRACRFRNVPTNEGTGALITLDENGSERADQIRIADCVGDGSPDGSNLNAQVDGIVLKNYVNTVFVTNTSMIRLNRSYHTTTTWEGEFLYFQNAEAERASGAAGFTFSSAGSGGNGNFITVDNCFSCTNEGHGIELSTSLDASVNITNPNVRDNKGHGILVDSNGGNTSIVNPVCGGNSKSNSGTNHGITIGSDIDNVYIAGGHVGGNLTLSGTGTQGYGIFINGSNHDNIKIIGVNLSGNATGTINNTGPTGSGNYQAGL